MERRLIKAADLAVYLGTTRGQVYQMVSRRQVPFVKMNRSTRFDLTQIEEWIKRKAVQEKVG